MNIGTAIKKGLLGALTFAVSFITPQLVLGLVPDKWEELTVGSIIALVIVAVTNAIKNWAKK
jgi:hypothetical protein